jgi:drug/metabolite transporter (DMT)-like permease
MALFCSVLPFLLITEGIRRVGASRSALISTVGPVSTLVLAALLLGETLVPSQLAGAALVIVAILALEGKLPPIFRRGERSRSTR